MRLSGSKPCCWLSRPLTENDMIDDTEIKMARANRLKEELESKLTVRDVLSEYRKWLDRNGIPAETTDGWPTEHAYNKDNINAFLTDMLNPL